MAGDSNEKMSLTISASDEDVRRYAGASLSDNKELTRLLVKFPELRGRIVEEVAEKANGMFLMAVLHMESLHGKCRKSDIEKALRTLPEKLDKAYDEAIQRIKSDPYKDWEMVQKALVWVVKARRPLHIDELSHALSLELGQQNSLDLTDIVDGETVVNQCGGLLVIEKGSFLVRLAHETAQIYFQDHTTHIDMQLSLAEACLSCLQLDDLIMEKEPTAMEVCACIDKFLLLRYCARYWGLHNVEENNDNDMTQRVLAFLGNDRKSATIVYVLALPDQPNLTKLAALDFDFSTLDGGVDTVFPGATSMCMASFFGLCHVALTLCSQSSSVDMISQRCSRGRTPLHYAAGNEQAEMIKFLTDRGADVSASDNYGVTALHLAAAGSSVEIVKLLLEANALLEARSTLIRQDSTPFTWATYMGRLENVKILHGAGANSEGSSREGTPLHLAIYHSLEMVEWFMSRGANTEAEDILAATPLCLAASVGRLAELRCLHQHNAKACVSSYLGTPLELSIVCKNSELNRVEAFLKSLDWRHGGTEDIIRFSMRSIFSNHTCREEAENAYGHMLQYFDEPEKHKILKEDFCHALALGSFVFIDMLERLGADIRQAGPFSKSILHWSVHYNRVDCYEIGIYAGLTQDTEDAQGRYAVHHAASGNCLEMLTRLLNEGTNVDVADRNGWTPLHWAVFQGCQEVVILLIDSGGNKYAVDNQGRTPIQLACDLRPLDGKLLHHLGMSANDAKVVASEARYSLTELHWMSKADGHLHRMCRAIERADAKDELQLLSSVIECVSEVCFYRRGELTHGKLAKLAYLSSQAYYDTASAEYEDRVARMDLDKDESGFASSDCDEARLAFCSLCANLTFGRRFYCSSADAHLCARCIVDAPRFFPGCDFVRKY